MIESVCLLMRMPPSTSCFVVSRESRRRPPCPPTYFVWVGTLPSGPVEATGGGVDCAGFLSLILIMNFRTSSIRESQQKVHVSRLVPERVSSSKTQRLSRALPENLRAPAPRRLRPPRTLTTTPPHLRALRAPQEAERTHLGRRS